MSEARRAAEYERLYPGAVSDEGQRAERMDRINFREEVGPVRRRRGRTRLIVVPDLPWRAER
jgi:hypothetical protein